MGWYRDYTHFTGYNVYLWVFNENLTIVYRDFTYDLIWEYHWQMTVVWFSHMGNILICYIYIWLYMIICDYMWLNMIIYDYIWLYMVIWLYMIIYDYIWLYMVIYDYIWLYMLYMLRITTIHDPWAGIVSFVWINHVRSQPYLSSMCFKAHKHSPIVIISNTILVGLISNIYSGTIWCHWKSLSDSRKCKKLTSFVSGMLGIDWKCSVSPLVT